jgi:hypothetical protein
MLLEHGRPLLVFICSGFTLAGLQTHGRGEKLNGIQQTGDRDRTVIGALRQLHGKQKFAIMTDRH